MNKDELISEVLGEEAVITPSDIYQQEFKAALMGGYDKEDVDNFLERVANAFEGIISHVETLKEQLDQEKSYNADQTEREAALQEALEEAQRHNESVSEAARREADAIVEEARLVRQRAELDSVELPAGLKEEIENLKDARNRLRTDLRAMLAAHNALLQDIPSGEDNAHERAQYIAGEPDEALSDDSDPDDMEDVALVDEGSEEEDDA